MATYAALVSLMNTMEQIQNHPRLSNSLDKYQIESLGERVGFFLDFVESYNSHSGIRKEEVEDLESQIASAAHAAEDVIESHIVGQILAGSTEKSPSFLNKIIEDIKKKLIKVQERIQSKDEKSSIQRVIEDMDTIKEKAIKVKEEKGSKDQQPTYSHPAAPSRVLTTGKTTMVGFDGYLTQLLDGLTGWQSDRQIIPITGMGGIGKTTLARSVYENLLIVQHFDVHAWITISQEYNVRKILSEILSCLGESTSGMEIEDQLGEQLHKILSGRRYLIILDDMWGFEAWDKIKFYLPDNRNRSRIIVTTRICSIATHFSSLALALNLLNDDQSWNVFCEKVFGEEGCPLELEKVGKEIVQKCRGLPLSIAVIGGLLRKSSRTQEYWKNVENDLSSILNSAEDNQCFNILFLSYRHLPAYLKPCFLYLGIFSEDHEISISQLIELWVAEGFIKPKRDQSLEEVAETYIKDFVDRNLILVRSLHHNGEFKTCSIHDLLRDLCIKVAEREKFFCVMRELDNPQDIDRERRIVIPGSISKKQYQNQVFHILKSTSVARSVISEGWCNILSKSKLLRVLYNVVANSVTEQVNFRFLPFYPIGNHGRSNAYKLPPSISLLWNLQTLNFVGTWIKVVAPSEIWEMPQLRHLKFSRICLPDPPNDERDGIVLRNLQTLERVLNFRCSEEAYKRMPNIKELHIVYDDFWGEGVTSLSNYCLYNVGRLNKLESLSYFFYKEPNRHDLLQNLMFPKSLKKLHLYNCGLHWNDLRIIGLLPHLEVLQLHWNAVKGLEWNSIEGEFLRLKFLEIFSCTGLTYWNAESSYFPVLEKLVLHGLRKLDEIPSGVGEIPTLKSIVVSNCSISVAISAIKILEEQEKIENQGLHVRIRYWDCMKLEEFRKIVEQEGFTSRNFQFGLGGV